MAGHSSSGSATHSHDEAGAGNVRDMAQEHNMTFCAVDWIGMASDDILNVALDLLDMSHFPTLPDRGQQGFLNFMFLGRAMITADGLCANAAFQVNGNCVIDRSELFRSEEHTSELQSLMPITYADFCLQLK